MADRGATADGRMAAADAYRREVRRRVAARVPLTAAVLIVCGAIGTVFELLRFPERRPVMLTYDLLYWVIGAVIVTVARRRPQASVVLLVVVTNLLGFLLNVYHAVVGAQVAMCIWTLTALLSCTAILLPWGWRAQALASVGAVAGYPLMLQVGEPAVLVWAAGGAYLMVVIAMSLTAAGLIDRYLATDFELAHALSEREGRLRTYFDLSLVGTAIVGRDGTWLEVNEELCRILGYGREELLRTRWTALVPEAARATDGAQLASVLSGESATVSRETELVRRDGGTIRAIVSVRALPGPLGPADHLMVVVQDVTQRRQAEREREQLLQREQDARREAEAASRAKDDFLAMASHELRSPLTPILGWAGLLREGSIDVDKRLRGALEIERCGRSLARLIDDLLDVSRIVSGKLRMATRPVAVGPLVDAAVESMRPAAEAKGIRLEADAGAGRERVLADPDRLQQVLWNLVSNAIKFTDRGGSVKVEIVRTAGQVEMRVRDTGRGIAPELLPRVFERFWQADTTTSRRHGGLGLGLSIVRHLVELHGGTVRAESAGVGQGAVFTVSLPATAAQEAILEGHVRRDGATRALRGARVLVVDDEDGAKEMIRVALELCGVEVRTAGSAAQALEVLEGWAPNVLVSDIMMAERDGYALIRELRAREAAGGGHVPALAFTALARQEDRARAIAAGFDGYVAKPVSPMQLITAVAGMTRPGNGHS